MVLATPKMGIYSILGLTCQASSTMAGCYCRSKKCVEFPFPRVHSCWREDYEESMDPHPPGRSSWLHLLVLEDTRQLTGAFHVGNEGMMHTNHQWWSQQPPVPSPAWNTPVRRWGFPKSGDMRLSIHSLASQQRAGYQRRLWIWQGGDDVLEPFRFLFQGGFHKWI